MVVFWILAAVMTGVALAFVLVPLLRGSRTAAPAPLDANLDVLRAQRREIDADVASGVLPADAREEALRELVARAESDLPDAPAKGTKPAPPPRRPVAVAVLAAILIPVAAIGLYLKVGEPRGLEAAHATPAKGPGEAAFSDQQIVAMVDTLAKKVRDRPDDVQGWSLLARSMNALGRYPEAVDAYEHLAKLVPNNADVLADWADSLAMKNGRNLKGRPYELVKQALAIDARHQKALALAGTAALNESDYPTAVKYWQALSGQLAPGSEDHAKVTGIIEEIRGRAAASGKPLPPAMAAQGPVAPAMPPATAAATPPAAPPKPAFSPPAAPAAASKPPAPASTVSGTVTVAPDIGPKIAITDTLFIYARAEGGSRVPLAILRGQARELPRAFVLDDTMSMAPGMNLSSAQAVRIEARVSKTGNAMPQPGDLVGTSAVVKPGARDVKIVIDRTLP